ncbi:IPT/TIG domain-containing protein [Petroclostridium sp. X23]|uniref:IPT/TIG domain-containing protein n=1 Tax=Petroclostridium sp. X23 TaxID=3045146 RepID=UPI0024AD1716|nr:IPT/TIG domain-containing protein [Petroclostridium sp. X23]WHH57373.1 IPT/TIG domain-containing protein [Petroclostridium sp. X23]
MKSKVISLLIALSMLLGLLPVNVVTAADGDPEVTISYMYDRFGSQPEQTIFTINDNDPILNGWTIDTVSIWYVGGTNQEVKVSRYGPRISGSVANGAAIESIIVFDKNNKNANYVIYEVPSGQEVKVESAAESEFQPSGPITLMGKNIETNARASKTITVGTVEGKVQDIESDPDDPDNDVKIIPKDDTPFGSGSESQKIVFKTTKEDLAGRVDNTGTKTNYTLSINSTYENVVRIIGSLNLSGVEMYPNSGQKDDVITFTSKSIAEAYDVYFVKNVTDQQEYKKERIGTPVGNPVKEDPNDPSSNYVYSIKVPDLGSASGEYYIVFTNKNSVAQGISQKYVLQDPITPSQYAKFTYVTAGNPSVIDDFNPKSAPEQTPTLVTVKGFNIGRVVLENTLINPDANPTIGPDGTSEIELDYTTDPKLSSLKIAGKDYSGATVKRYITVSIGGDTVIKSANFPASGQETIGVQTQKYTLTQLENLITVKIRTVVTPEVVTSAIPVLTFYKEVYSTEPFVFVSTTEKPEVSSVVPEVIPVEVDSGLTGTYHISRNVGQNNEVEVNIYGDKFLVTKKDNQIVYPKIELGQIIVDPNDTLNKPLDTDPDKLNKFTFGKENPNRIVTFEVLDNEGTTITGDMNREIGSHIRMVLKLSNDETNREKIEVIGKQPIIIHNPWRGSDSEFNAYPFAEKVEFKNISVSEFPSISSIQPSVVSTKGGDAVTITGTNFKPGLEVYIDGLKVTGVKVDNSGDKDKITFNAPARREGMAKVIIVNPAKAFAVGSLYYTVTYTDPKLISISPNRGTQDDSIVIQGQNFKLKDATVDASQYNSLDEMLIYRLIGTRVFINNEDINDYYRSTDGEIALFQFLDGAANPQGGTLALKEHIFSVPASDSDTDMIQLGKDFRSIILLKKDDSNPVNNRFYKIKENMDGTFTITDDRNEEYDIYLTDKKLIEAKKGNVTYNVLQSTKGSITLQSKSTDETVVLQSYTPYATARMEEDEGVYYDRIVGNRVFLMTTSQLIFTVPPKTKIGQGKYDAATGAEIYDVKIINPDAKSAEKKDSFYYISPAGIRPQVISFNPKEGSADGGNMITFTAPEVSDPKDPTGFVDNSTGKTRVIIGNQEISKENILISTNGKQLSVVIPKCNKDFQTLGVDKIIEPIVLINPNGVTFHINMNAPLEGATGYTYVLVNNKPNIVEVRENKGNVVGEDKVYIFGSGFRYFEPFEDVINVNGKRDNGEAYTELNGDGEWTSLGSGGNVEDLRDDGVIDDKKILPTVYFGSNKAELLSFSEGTLIVKAPIGQVGTVNVYVVNNDFGVSNTLPYTYGASQPTVTSLAPSSGTKYGETQVFIDGADFKNSRVRIYNGSSTTLPSAETSLMLVRFGDVKDRKISNSGITDIKDNNYGSIVNGKTTVQTGNLTVDYDATGGGSKLKFTLEEQGKTYTTAQAFEYDDETVYLPLTELAYTDTSTGAQQAYTKKELVRVQVDTTGGINRLVVERGYAPVADANAQGDQIVLNTPNYYTIGKIPVIVINPDGGQGTGQFEYTNPSSHPVITNITKSGTAGGQQQVNGKDAVVIRMSYKGGSRITITGLDFRANATVLIGTNTAKIEGDAEGREDILPTQIKFTMPAVSENAIENADGTPKYHAVVIQNEDGAAVSSATVSPLPIYIQFVKGETFPAIEKVTPGYGSSIGGIAVTITGKDFRKTMPEDYGNKKLAVYFGDVQISEEDIDWEKSNETTIVINKIPAHAPGTVKVKVENPDLSLSDPSGTFIYTSNPKIVTVEDGNGTTIETISVLGGQKIYIKGSGFVDGAKVFFNPKQPLQKINSEEAAQGEPIYINGVMYDLQDGIEGTEPKVENGGQTITVTTPEGILDGRGIIVVNPDKGASDVYEGVAYSLPGIEAPTGKVYAELVYDRYIKLNWSEVEGAREYEIYVVRNENNKELIGATKLTSYLYQDLEPRTTYQFIIRAVGEFTISKPSMESEKIKTGREVGPPDDDGELNEQTTMEKMGDTAHVSIGENNFAAESVIDLTRGTLAGSKEVVVSIPAGVISDYRAGNIQILGSDFSILFNPNVFNVSKIQQNRNKDDAGVRFKIARFSDSPNTKGGQTLLSSQYMIEAEVYVGTDRTSLEKLASQIAINLDFDSTKADMRRLNNVTLNRYDSSQQSWTPVGYKEDAYNVSIRGYVDKVGRYAVIGSKN